jgi:hypothetical protein
LGFGNDPALQQINLKLILKGGIAAYNQVEIVFVK